MSASFFDSDVFNDRLFFPRRDVSPPPSGASDRMIEVPGASLHLRTHHLANARATILLFHGNGEVVADYDRFAILFASAGIELAVADYRGYGASTGRPSLRSAIEDAPRVLAAVEASSLIVMGRSLGSSCAAELSEAPRVRGVIFESGFTDLHGLARRRGFTLPPSPEDAFFDPLPKLARSTRPLLVLHGAEDTLIPPEEGRAAYERAGSSDKQLVLVPGHGHNDLLFADAYHRSIREFVARVVSGA